MVTTDRKMPGMAVTDRKPVREQAVTAVRASAGRPACASSIARPVSTTAAADRRPERVACPSSSAQSALASAVRPEPISALRWSRCERL
jgi:hypothetical protein